MSKATGKRRLFSSVSSRNSKKTQYFDETIRLYYEEGLSGLEISKILPVHNSNIYRWLDEYDLKHRSKETEGMGIREKEMASEFKDNTKAKRICGVRAPESTGTEATEVVKDPTELKEDKANNEVEELRKKVMKLETELKNTTKALQRTKIQAALYDEIINVAEQKFKVPIRKKAGTKQ